MIRWSVLAAGFTVVAGAALVTGASVPPKTVPSTVKPDDKVLAVIGQKTGYINMAKVMREYKLAKTSVERLNARKTRMTANLMGMRGMYTDLQAAIQKSTDNDVRFQMQREMVTIARQIEDGDRTVNKLLNDSASMIISEIHDGIRAATAEMAREHGLVAVLAYPDAVTLEEKENPMIKELRLKPPAAHPFYLDPSVEYTDELIAHLNAKIAVENDDK